MEKNWINLFSETFLWTKDDRGMVYNCLNGKSFLFKNKGTIKKIVTELNNADNLYSYPIDNLPTSNELNKFINNIISTKSGQIVVAEVEDKPISLKPISKIQDNITHYKWERNNHIEGSVINNVNELIFYINGSESGSDDIYKQVYYPIKSSTNLNYSLALDFFKQSLCSESLNTISIVGNMATYPYASDLLQELNKYNLNINIYCIDKDIKQGLGKFWRWTEDFNFNLHVICTNIDNLCAIKNSLTTTSLHFYFYVKQYTEYKTALQLVSENNIENYTIRPIYEDNIPFFEKFVYASKNEIKNYHLSKREIFINQQMNTFSFGKLFVMPDGSVCADHYVKKSGYITDNIQDIVYKELTEGNSWLRVRNQEPCCHCMYQWLCPSPSNYESAIGKTNLCHVKNNI